MLAVQVPMLGKCKTLRTVRKRVQMSSRMFTATKFVSILFSNQNSACISAVPSFAGYGR